VCVRARMLAHVHVLARAQSQVLSCPAAREQSQWAPGCYSWPFMFKHCCLRARDSAACSCTLLLLPAPLRAGLHPCLAKCSAAPSQLRARKSPLHILAALRLDRARMALGLQAV